MKIGRWRLFRREVEPKSDWEIIAWWEARRIPYNLIVGVAGVVAVTVMSGTGVVAEHLHRGCAGRRLWRSDVRLGDAVFGDVDVVAGGAPGRLCRVSDMGALI